MENETQLILKKLDVIKTELDSIKEHMGDITLTRDDLISLQEAEKDLTEGKTKRLD